MPRRPGAPAAVRLTCNCQTSSLLTGSEMPVSFMPTATPACINKPGAAQQKRSAVQGRVACWKCFMARQQVVCCIAAHIAAHVAAHCLLKLVTAYRNQLPAVHCCLLPLTPPQWPVQCHWGRPGNGGSCGLLWWGSPHCAQGMLSISKVHWAE